ncbi:HAMP domain-containing protein, partial [bacterium]|nr:HAMP domain-containing protein [candidate division CSSED10-310 bacterium]
MKIGLRFKLTAGIMAIMFGIMASITLVLLEKMREEAVDQRIAQARRVAGAIEGALELFDSLDFNALRPMLDNQFAGSGVLAARLENSGGQALYAFHPAYHDAVLRRSLRMAITRGGLDWVIAPREADRDRLLVVSVPVRHQGGLLGGLSLVLPLREMEQRLHGLWGATVKFIVVEYAVIITFIILLLSMLVIRPIQRMVEITQRIAEGEFHHQVQVATGDELGELARSLNIMSRRLKEGREDLEAHVRSLEAAYDALKRAQREILQSEKMACVGGLAAGVAHEIGNPLSSILGYIELLGEESSADGRKEFAGRARQEILRIEQIIRGLLDFSRPSALEITAVDLREVLQQTLPLVLAHQSFKGVRVVPGLDPRLPAVIGDFGLVQQVLFNILLNAAQAMNGEGIIRVGATVA